MKIELLLLVSCFLIGEFVSCQEITKSVSEVLKEILKKYDNTEPPRTETPTEIKIAVYIINLWVVNGQLTVQFYMKQLWTDPRLAFAKSKRILKTPLQVSPPWIERIWKPDTYFINELASARHQLLTEHRLLTIDNDGTVFFVNHVTVRFNCPMQFSKFPFDIQTCSMRAESFGQTDRTLHFRPMGDSHTIQISEEMFISAWSLLDKSIIDCSVNYTSGTFSCLEFQLIFRRDIGYYIRQIYLPSILVVLLSWITFWINRKASTARMNLGLTTIFFMVILCIAVEYLKPIVSYLTAIDIWMGVCGAFVCLALVEFVVVHFLGNRGANQESEDDAMDMIKRYSNDKKPASPSEEKLISGAAKLDLICRIVFPILFLIFNVIYWVVYQLPRHEQ